MQFSTPSIHFESDEQRLSREVMGMPEKQARRLIEREGLLSFVEKRDKEEFKNNSLCGHSYRINLHIHKGKVVNTSIG